MMEQWEEFKGGPNGSRKDRLYVSLNHKGQFLLSRSVLAALGSPAAVVLSFERRNAKIGIRAASPTLTNAFPVKRRNQAHSRMVLASPFCRNYGIRVAGTVAFNHVEIGRDGIIVLELDKTTRVSRT